MSFHSEAGGKGDLQRKREVDSETYVSNWDRIFKKDNKPVVGKCQACQGEGGVYDAGHWADCKFCK